jgi:antitoxin YefM
MQAVAYSNVRNNLKSFMRKVNDDSDVVFITSQNPEENAVLMSQNDYENMLENLYVRSSAKNYERILESFKSIKSGEATEHDWQ